MREIVVPLLLFSISAVLLTVIQLPAAVAWLAWIALVPFVLACDPQRKRWVTALTAYVVGVVYWLGNTTFVSYVVVPGYVAMGFYLGLYWPAAALGIRYGRGKGWTLVIAVPLIYAGLEAWQEILLTGFAWRYLAHSQYRMLPLIQMADTFGAMGISVVIAAVNGWLAGLVIALLKKNRPGKRLVMQGVCVGLILLGAVGYGYWRLSTCKEHWREGPLVGSVQPNIPSNVKELADNGPLILRELLAHSRRTLDHGAQLTVWPETIVLATMNREYLEVCHPDSLPMIYHRTIANHVRGKAYLLFGAHAAVFDIEENDELDVHERYNSAYLYDPQGTQDEMRYDKIHLVPFGEFMPLKEQFPKLYDMISILSPYDYDYHLTHGREYDRFEMETSGKTYEFGVLICYEDTDGEIARRMSWQKEKGKADFLVNISNDGWYVLYRDGQVIPSAELSQRTAICAFRAVENRISIVRSVNAGISCLIEPTGQIRDGFVEGDLPYRAMQRQGVEGWFVDRVVIDDRVTAFTHSGGLWGWLLRGAVLGLAAVALSQKMSLRKTRMAQAQKQEVVQQESKA